MQEERKGKKEDACPNKKENNYGQTKTKTIARKDINSGRCNKL